MVTILRSYEKAALMLSRLPAEPKPDRTPAPECVAPSGSHKDRPAEQ